MNIERITEITISLLNRYDLELHSIRKKREFGMPILEVLVKGKNLDASKLGEINQALNDEIDEYLPEKYNLEVSTAGAIRVLNSINETKDLIGKYLLVTKNHKKIKGVLEKVEEDTLFIKVNEKGRIRVIETSFSEADEVKLTVKF